MEYGRELDHYSMIVEEYTMITYPPLRLDNGISIIGINSSNEYRICFRLLDEGD